jgi:hypothetical protein
MICFYTASPEAKRAIRASSLPPPDLKPAADGEPAPTTPRPAGWEKLLTRFWTGEQEFCDERFKLIPSVVSSFFPSLYIYNITYP